jgi:hypothetical protein
VNLLRTGKLQTGADVFSEHLCGVADRSGHHLLQDGEFMAMETPGTNKTII